MVSLKDQFYLKLWNIRSQFVYLDALDNLTRKKKNKGEEVTEQDKEDLIKSVVSKMEQKVEELRYVNELLEKHLTEIPQGVHRVIDMAGGAGDVGLGITTQLLSEGRDINHVEIVDPQTGTDLFMHTIIDHLPFQQELEKIVHHALEHNNGYLQNADITPDAMVVAKHACGTLTDDSLDLWKDSDSKIFVAMTCCQDKACGHPSRYDIPQEEWDRLTTESGWTNLEDEIGKSSGQKKKELEEKMIKGKEAMKILDMARVDYLRRHGFQAELYMTDKFPKGDVIIARRLPKNFLIKLKEIEQLEKDDPTTFDNLRLKLDYLIKGKGSARGAKVENMLREFGDDWVLEDFIEIDRRLDPTIADAEVKEILSDLKKRAARERTRIVKEREEREEQKAEKAREKEFMDALFADSRGRIDIYARQHAEKTGVTIPYNKFNTVINALQNKINRMKGENLEQIRISLDKIMEEMGY